MRNKFISLVCALAMLMSMFTAFTVSAAAPSISAKATLDGENANIVVSYADMTATSTVGFKMILDPEVFDVTAFERVNGKYPNVAIEDAFASGTANFVTASNKFAFTWAYDGFVTAPGSSDVLTITVPVKDATKLPATITLQEVMIKDVNGEVETNYGTEDQNPDQVITVENATLLDPDAPTPKPTSPTRPEEQPVEPKPTPVTGVRIEGTGVVEDGVATITVSYADMTATSTVGFKMVLDPEVFDVTAFERVNGKYPNVAIEDAFASGTANFVTASNKFAFTWAYDGFVTAPGSSDILTITVPVKDATKLPATITLQEVMIKDVNGEVETNYGTEDQNPDQVINVGAIVVDEAAAVVPTDKPVKTIALVDYVADDAADAATAAEAEGKDVYVTVDMTKKDDSAAVYGTDFTAVYNGKELTAAEYSNLISGYTEDSMADVINGLTFNIYNNDVKNVSTTVNSVDAEGNAEMIADPVDKSLGKTPVVTVKDPKLSATVSKSTVYTTDTGVKITVKVTNPAEDGVLSYEVSGSAVTNVAFDAETGVLTFDGNAKGTANFTFTYAYTNADGEADEVTLKKSVTVRVKSTPTPDGGSSDNDSYGDGPIAGGTTTTTPVGGVLPNATFTDLGSVTWAQEAITKLAAMGAISGRGNGIFDPNANITRAEYCQILVNAIGKSQEAADSNFDDVATDAWYYHSVSVASKHGIVSGYGDGNFGPDKLITRRDMALMTMKAAQVMGVDLTAQRTLTFADADQFEYAAEAVNTLANAGIINGMSETEFAPLSYATRAQAAKIIYDTFVK